MAYCKNEMEHTLILRLHRAPHDSAQNEAERTNAAIGEALTTARPVEPPADPFYVLTVSQMDSMTLKEVDEHCSSWKMENTWKLAREVSYRIHDEPGPWKNGFFVSVSSYCKKQQILHFLAKYLVQWKKAPSSKRSKMCGNALFFKLQKLKCLYGQQGFCGFGITITS